MMPRPLIVDCDPGRDDAVALFLALAAPEALETLAVTTVAGNVPLALTAANARRICAFAGRGDVPVYAGCPRPILRPLVTAPHVHGESGIAGLDLPPADAPLAPAHAVDALIEILSARRRAGAPPVTIAALGPLTNLALAIVKAPEILEGVREIVLMGGSLGAGNVTPAAEFNIHVDPHAAAVVFSAGAPLTMIGLDVTRRTSADAARIEALRARGGRVGAAVADMLANGPPAREGGEPLLHDVCVIAHLLDPGLIETRPMRVAVETAEGPEVGRTRAGPDGWGGDVRVAVDLDAEGLYRLLADRLARL